jgi:predicted RNase H-like HicB family nuclease
MTASDLAARRYTEVVQLDQMTTGERCCIAYSPEVPHCIGQGWTPGEAIANLRLARVDLFQSFLDDGLPVPRPVPLGDVVLLVTSHPWGLGCWTVMT